VTQVLRPPGVDRIDRIIWSVDQEPTIPLHTVKPAGPGVQADTPVGAAIAFMTVDGRAQRYLDKHPENGPSGCVHCCRSYERCVDCRVAVWALHARRIVKDARRAARRPS